MELTVKERVALMNVLPQEGNFADLKIIRTLQDSLSFSEEEHKILNFRNTETGMAWDDSDEMIKDVPIGERASDVLFERLTKLDFDSKLTPDHMPIYEKFVLDR